MPANSEDSQPPLSPEVIDSLLVDIPPALLLAWLDTQLYGRGILRGFQQTPKTLSLAPVRARFKEVLQHHSGAAASLVESWKIGNGELLEEVHALSEKKLLAQLPELEEKHGARTMHLTLMLDGREKILQQPHDEPKAKAETDSASKKPVKKLAAKNAADPIIDALRKELEQQRQLTNSAEENLHTAQLRVKQLQEQFKEKQQQAGIRERELTREVKRETARAANAEQLLEEMKRHADRNERRVKKLQQEQEEADLEIKRLRRQVRQQQQLAEDLRKQLAATPAKITEKGTTASSSVTTPQKVTKNAPAPPKIPQDPADQLFYFEIAGHHFQISARQVSMAVERNDEELVYSLTQALFELREKNAAGHKMFLDRVRTFDRYSARILTGDTMRVLVDASNVARFEKNKYGKGSLTNLLEVRDELRSRSYFPIILIADASLPHFIDEPHELKRLIQQGIIQITNKGEEADEYLARLAQQTGAFVVTNDVNFHLKIAPHFEPLRIGFTIDHGAVYLHEF